MQKGTFIMGRNARSGAGQSLFAFSCFKEIAYKWRFFDMKRGHKNRSSFLLIHLKLENHVSRGVQTVQVLHAYFQVTWGDTLSSGFNEIF